MSDFVPELRTVEQTAPLDWKALGSYLARQGMELHGDCSPRQFAGGLANLNYLVVVNGRQAVLRRPPVGKLPPGAYDMGREFQILSGLSKVFPLAPAALHFCADPSVIGAPFQLIEFRSGVIVRSIVPPELGSTSEIGDKLADAVLGALVTLHAVDAGAAGLAKLGRPNGFLQRSLENWARRALLATEEPRPQLIAELAKWLQRHLVPDRSPVVLHNDLKLDNIVLSPESLETVAVLDWDQCTRGDPLFDLATTLSYWSEPGDPPAMLCLRQMPTTAPGFPTRAQAVLRYGMATGRDLSDFKFYRVLGLYKLAVIFHQLHARYRQGDTSDERYAEFGSLGDGILEFAHAVSADEFF